MGEMVKDGCELIIGWIWKLYNIAFESGVVPETWSSAVIVPVYNGKRVED